MNHILNYTLPILILYVRDEMKMNYTQAGILWTVLIVNMTLLSIFVGYFADKNYKIRYLLIFGGLVIMSASWLLISTAQTYNSLLIYFALFGIGAAGFHPPAMAIITDMFEGDKGKSLSINMVVGMIGSAISPLVFIGILAISGSWQMTSIILGGSGLIVAVILALISLRDGQFGVNEVFDRVQPNQTIDIKFLLSPLILIPLFFVAIRSSLNRTSSLFTSLLFEDYMSLSKEEASLATAIVLGFAALFTVVGGTISDRYKPRVAIILSSFGLFIGAFSLVYLTDFSNIISFGIFYFILNASYHLGSPATSALLADRVSPERRGKIFGALFSLGQILSMVVPPIFGNIKDNSGINSAFMFILSLAVTAFALGTYIFIDDKKFRDKIQINLS